MAYITVSAGWNANHQIVAFLNGDRKRENKSGSAFYQENEKVRLSTIFENDFFYELSFLNIFMNFHF